jgi:hypothetical protein
MGEFSPFHWLVIALLILPYFIPAFVARNKRNAKAIFWLNFLLGWTVVGWVAAFIWALTNDAPAQVIVSQPGPSVLCAACGKYSAAGTKFCSMCGAQFTT